MLEFLKTKTIQDTTVVTAGMTLSTILSAVSIFLLARWLGPSNFGLYATSLALVVIVTDAAELAISGTIVNFGAKADEQRARVLKYGFYLKLVLGTSLGLAFAALSQPLAKWLYPALARPLLVSALFIPLVFLQRFPRSILQGQKRFWADSTLEVCSSFFRLAAVAGFYFLGKLSVVTGLAAYLSSSLITFGVGAFLISWNFLTSHTDVVTRRHFFHFQKWLTAGFILAAVHGRIDSTILVKLAGPAATGIYQAAFRFFMPALQLGAALSLVFAPRFASFATKAESRTYLKKAAKLTGLLGLAILLIIPLAPLFVKFIFGASYEGAVLPARILSLGFTLFIAGAPFTAFMIYGVNRIRLFVVINLLQLILLTSLDFYLIPKLGAIGAAWGMSLTLAIINLIIMFSAIK